jgi:hypothetical protein
MIEKYEGCPSCNDGTFWHYDLQTCTRCPPPIQLSHADLCRLSVIFNRGADLRDDQDRKINEWLKLKIGGAA